MMLPIEAGQPLQTARNRTRVLIAAGSKKKRTCHRQQSVLGNTAAVGAARASVLMQRCPGPHLSTPKGSILVNSISDINAAPLTAAGTCCCSCCISAACAPLVTPSPCRQQQCCDQQLHARRAEGQVLQVASNVDLCAALAWVPVGAAAELPQTGSHV